MDTNQNGRFKMADSKWRIQNGGFKMVDSKWREIVPEDFLFKGSGGTGGRRSSRGELSCSSGDPADYLNSFIIGLYSEIFHLVVAIINRCVVEI